LFFLNRTFFKGSVFFRGKLFFWAAFSFPCEEHFSERSVFFFKEAQELFIERSVSGVLFMRSLGAHFRNTPLQKPNMCDSNQSPLFSLFKEERFLERAVSFF
jgi:hypothetical protein